LVADIRLGNAECSDPYVLDGWGQAEGGHRWAVGQESRMRLPIVRPGFDYVVAVHMAPWCDANAIPAQTEMLAVNGRLLATVQLCDHRVLAWRMPVEIDLPEVVLSFSHLCCRLPRPPAGIYLDGRHLGVMVLSVRVFRLPKTPGAARSLPPLPGSIADGVLVEALRERTGLSPKALAYRFEGIGHDCEFGLLQREFGAEPISLMRFTGVATPHLVDALVAGFAGIGAPDAMKIYVDQTVPPTWRVNETRYYIWYGTGKTPEDVGRDTILREHCRRLAFLQRKFMEDLRDGSKIFVVTRGESMTEPEALAVFCALNMEGRNTLLWTVHGDGERTGQVDAIMPGFLCGHLGILNAAKDGTPDAWLSVLANAFLLAPPSAFDAEAGALDGEELSLPVGLAD
jgi:hypothetical protein